MEHLKEWREQKGLSLEAAGSLIGVSGVQWQRYETGARQVSPTRAAQVEAITGISRHDLRPDVFGSAKEAAA